MSPGELYAWYDRELGSRGWVLDPLASSRATNEDSIQSWRKDDVVARIAVLTKGDPRNLPASVTDRFQTIYEIALIAEPKRSFAPIPT